MAVEIKRNTIRDIIASKRALCNPQAPEEYPVNSTCGERKEGRHKTS